MGVAVVLSKRAAQALTARIRKAGEDFGALLLQAHDGRAWEQMSYATWQDYVAGEFPFTRSNSYRLLAQARVERDTGERVPARLAERAVASLRSRQVPEITNAPSEALQQALTEQRSLAAERGGPAPKPAGKRSAGYRSPVEHWRTWCRELEESAEQMGDDPLDPEAAQVLRRLNDVLVGMLRR